MVSGSERRPFEKGSGRLELAQAIATVDNPLTARVIVNRIWRQHFHSSLVATPSDFGLRCDPPTHPEMLDWLASQFVKNGWSIKHMHRLIMTSKTWQLASAHHEGNLAKDSDNKLYWRFDRRRLDAESIRDSMLQLGGNLDLKRPGAHPFPEKGKWRFSAHYQFKAVYPSNHRSVYLMVQRLHHHPFLAIFNGPDTSASTPMRDRSIVPMQALFMSNSEFVETQSKGLADSLLNAEQDPTKRLQLAFARVYSRDPSESEIRRAHRYQDAQARSAGDRRRT